MQVVNSVFSGNSAMLGGAILSYQDFGEGVFDIVHSTFRGNLATGTLASYGGGAIHHTGTNSRLRVRNSVFWDNSTALGEADIHVSNWSDQHPSPRGTIESTLVGDSPAEMNDFGDTIVANPFFLDPLGTDGLPGTRDDDYRVASDSPAIDAGEDGYIPSDFADLDGDGDRSEPLPFDIAGNPRVQGGRVDMGAYEAPGSTSINLPPLPPTKGDGCDLGLFPSPFGTEVMLSDQSQLPARLEVFDILGRRLYQRTVYAGHRTVRVDSSTWPKGVYLFIQTGATGRCTQTGIRLW
jgi:hypothetical protein